MINHVYIIGPSENILKIGIAEDVQQRLSQLQVGCHETLQIFRSIPVPHLLTREIERACHKDLRLYRRHGEWFDVPLAFAEEVVERQSIAFAVALANRRRASERDRSMAEPKSQRLLEIESRINETVPGTLQRALALAAYNAHK